MPQSVISSGSFPETTRGAFVPMIVVVTAWQKARRNRYRSSFAGDATMG
jgi:hypothetical protein